MNNTELNKCLCLKILWMLSSRLNKECPSFLFCYAIYLQIHLNVLAYFLCRVSDDHCVDICGQYRSYSSTILQVHVVRGDHSWPQNLVSSKYTIYFRTYKRMYIRQTKTVLNIKYP